MQGFNQIILAGNVARDPEIKYTANGMPIAKFSIAVNRRSKDKDEVMFVNCVAFDKLADLANQHLSKGKPVLVKGRLQLQNYEDKNGVKKLDASVVLEGVTFLPDGKGRQGQDGEYQGNNSRQPNNSNSGGGYGDIGDEEIPF